MAIKIWYKAAEKRAVIAPSAQAVPSGWTASAAIDSVASGAEADNTFEKYEFGQNHVVWHHVRDYLYSLHQLDMQEVVITNYVTAASVDVQPTTQSIVHGNKATLTATVSPANASEKGVTWASSDATKATVDANGVVTGVAAGTATITATTKDGVHTDTCAVTVT
jgi:uncharacterized protein YjdB